MHADLHALPQHAPSSAAAAGFNETLTRYLAYRADAAPPLFEALAAEPDFPMGQCFKGYLTLLAFKQALVPAAAAALAQAKATKATLTPREALHVQALGAWIDGHLDRALALWAQISREHPLDILAFRLSHFNLFWLGRPQAMLASVLAVRPSWHEGLAGWGPMLSCHCFALEESGEYRAAEPHGRAAVAMNPADLWGTHAVAHALEMQNRHDDGMVWLQGLQANWAQGSNLVHHLWWHLGMMHIGRGDAATMLTLYDTRFRRLDSPLTQAQPDLYIDVQNAVSALYRLQHLGVDVGGRWRELADHAQARIGDCLSSFTLPHFMMALLADGREAAARQMIDAMRAFGAGANDQAALVADVALPLGQAQLAAHEGRPADALALLRPILDRLPELGGSHAQQEVLLLFACRTARAAASAADEAAVLARVDRRFADGWRSRTVFAHH